jgi:hypothetical protein
LYGGQVTYANERTGKEPLLEAWDTSCCMNFIDYLYGHQDGQDYNETRLWLLKEMDRKALVERSILQTTLLPVPLIALIDLLQCVLTQYVLPSKRTMQHLGSSSPSRAALEDCYLRHALDCPIYNAN